eukprot:4033865-Amphidinium_carterae.1
MTLPLGHKMCENIPSRCVGLMMVDLQAEVASGSSAGAVRKQQQFTGHRSRSPVQRAARRERCGAEGLAAVLQMELAPLRDFAKPSAVLPPGHPFLQWFHSIVNCLMDCSPKVAGVEA